MNDARVELGRNHLTIAAYEAMNRRSCDNCHFSTKDFSVGSVINICNLASRSAVNVVDAKNVVCCRHFYVKEPRAMRKILEERNG